ncbi:ThiF family adenylyltransferase [Mycobacterium sp. SMC-21]|uniref:ThiF family adenylyltransferase n=1 Tax=Mycobacterium sp. SMC-13 TaxID=3381626 RepID=UPI003875CF43
MLPDDGAHGAVLLAEPTEGPRGARLLVRQVIPAIDGVDYVRGTTGFHALRPEFVRDCAMRAHANGWAYVAVHNHGGFGRVRFSSIDLASHERGYPALVQLIDRPVIGLVLADGAAAGDIWLPDGGRADLAELIVAGRTVLRLRPTPALASSAGGRWDRQVRVFGDIGQQVLSALRVGIVGLGGAGSMINEFISRLGVGHLVLIDGDLASDDNLPRLVGAEPNDVGVAKTTIAAHSARRANPGVTVDEFVREVQRPDAQAALQGCDFIFLAADSHSARHFVNQVIEQRLIPGVQVGVKVPVSDDGTVGRIHVANRPLIPGNGCLWCNQLIDPTKLALDLAPETARPAARYVDELPAPSVIALNALAVAEAVNGFMMGMTGLLDEEGDPAYTVLFPREGDRQLHTPRRDPACGYCGDVRC